MKHIKQRLITSTILSISVLIFLKYAQVDISKIVFNVASLIPTILASSLASLSSTGIMGNLLAWLLLITISLAPSIYPIIRIYKKQFKLHDSILIFQSFIIFGSIYALINPISTIFFIHFELLAMSITFVNLIMISSYLVLEFLYRFYVGSENYRLVNVNLFLEGFGHIIIWINFTYYIPKYINPINSINPNFIVNLLYPLILLPIIIKFIQLTTYFQNDPYHVSLEKITHSIAKWSYIAIYIIFVLMIFLNIAEFLSLQYSNSINYSFSFPTPLVFILFVSLLMTKYFERNYLLKQDNDEII